MRKYIYFEPTRCDRLDLSVSDDSGKARVFIGIASSVIVFPLDELDKFIEFVNKAKELATELNPNWDKGTADLSHLKSDIKNLLK